MFVDHLSFSLHCKNSFVYIPFINIYTCVSRNKKPGGGDSSVEWFSARSRQFSLTLRCNERAYPGHLTIFRARRVDHLT